MASSRKGRSPVKPRLKLEDAVVTATLIETTEGFVSLLPLKLTMNDLSRREMFARLLRRGEEQRIGNRCRTRAACLRGDGSQSDERCLPLRARRGRIRRVANCPDGSLSLAVTSGVGVVDLRKNGGSGERHNV